MLSTCVGSASCFVITAEGEALIRIEGTTSFSKFENKVCEYKSLSFGFGEAPVQFRQGDVIVSHIRDRPPPIRSKTNNALLNSI